MAEAKTDKYADCKTVIEQDLHWGDVAYPPPCGVFVENTRYVIKDNDKAEGFIEEDSSWICRTCVPAAARSLKSKIKFSGGEYNAVKNFQLGYVCSWCCDSCEMRPDMIVSKGESVVGSIM